MNDNNINMKQFSINGQQDELKFNIYFNELDLLLKETAVLI